MDLFTTHAFVLTEGSVYERLRRTPSLSFDPHIAHAALIYDPAGAAALKRIHQEYLSVGARYGLPMIALTDTWRASKDRMARSPYRDQPVNQENARFLLSLRDRICEEGPPVLVGGLMGPSGDAYRPGEALPVEAAATYHSYQAQALAETQVDFLRAATLPAFSEALGIAHAMAATSLPYILSFVLRPSGTLLDGTPLDQAITEIDTRTDRPPVGYFANCIHPSVFAAALDQAALSPDLQQRILGLQANTSARSPEELDGSDLLESEDPDTFAQALHQVRKQFNLRVLGGCCGTDIRHIEALAQQYSTRKCV